MEQDFDFIKERKSERSGLPADAREKMINEDVQARSAPANSSGSESEGEGGDASEAGPSGDAGADDSVPTINRSKQSSSLQNDKPDPKSSTTVDDTNAFRGQDQSPDDPPMTQLDNDDSSIFEDETTPTTQPDDEIFSSQAQSSTMSRRPSSPSRPSRYQPRHGTYPPEKTPGEILFEQRLEKERKTYIPPETYTDLYKELNDVADMSSEEKLGIIMLDDRFELALKRAKPKWKMIGEEEIKKRVKERK